MRRILVPASVLAAGIMTIAAQQLRPEMTMAAAATALIATLDTNQLARIRWPFASEERFNWHFIPRERKGVSLKEMDARQRKAAFALLRAGLSEYDNTQNNANHQHTVWRDVNGDFGSDVLAEHYAHDPHHADQVQRQTMSRDR